MKQFNFTKEVYPSPEDTLRVKKQIIKKLRKQHFKFHNHLNLTEYIEAYPDPLHNHNGVAKDVCKKMEESGKFKCIEKGTKPEYIVEKAVKKDWKEKYWWVVLLIGGAMGFCLDIVKEDVKRNLWPETNQPQNTITKSNDTLVNHKN